jgi:hypothetical protein
VAIGEKGTSGRLNLVGSSTRAAWAGMRGQDAAVLGGAGDRAATSILTRSAELRTLCGTAGNWVPGVLFQNQHDMEVVKIS